MENPFKVMVHDVVVVRMISDRPCRRCAFYVADDRTHCANCGYPSKSKLIESSDVPRDPG